jgi:excisionase family DNA binding protein
MTSNGQQSLIPATLAARRLGISRQSLRRLIRQGEVNAVRVGNLQRVYIPQDEIDRIVSGRNAHISATKLAGANENLGDLSQPIPTVTSSPTSIEDIMTMPIPVEERWKLLTSSQLPRDRAFLNAMLALVDEC